MKFLEVGKFVDGEGEDKDATAAYEDDEEEEVIFVDTATLSFFFSDSFNATDSIFLLSPAFRISFPRFFITCVHSSSPLFSTSERNSPESPPSFTAIPRTSAKTLSESTDSLLFSDDLFLDNSFNCSSSFASRYKCNMPIFNSVVPCKYGMKDPVVGRIRGRRGGDGDVGLIMRSNSERMESVIVVVGGGGDVVGDPKSNHSIVMEPMRKSRVVVGGSTGSGVVVLLLVEGIFRSNPTLYEELRGESNSVSGNGCNVGRESVDDSDGSMGST